MADPKAISVIPVWSLHPTPMAANAFRLSRLDHDVQMHFGYMDIAPLVDAFQTGQVEVKAPVVQHALMVLGSRAFDQLYRQMTIVHKAMTESGYFKDE